MAIPTASRRASTLVRSLVGTVVLAVTACYASVDVPSYALEAVDEPIAEYEVRELDATDSARWLEDGRLFVETRSDGKYLHVTQLWVTLEPGGPARVEVRSWGQEARRMGAMWPRTDIRGTAWVSGDRDDLERADGPGLTLQARWRCMMSGSDQPGSLHLHLRPDQVTR